MLQLNDIKKYLNIESSTVKYDAFLNDLIEVAEDEIIKYCGQSIVQATIDYYFEWNGTSKLVPYNNCTVLNNLYERSEPSDSWAEVTGYLFNNPLPSISYEFDGSYYKANITHGYTTAPSEVLNVGNEMVYVMFEQSRAGTGDLSNTLGLSQKQTQGDTFSGTVTVKNMKPEWLRILNKYKRIND